METAGRLAALACVVIILLIILIPLSIGYVNYDEFAFKRNRFSNFLDMETVYGADGGGERAFITFVNEFKKFPRNLVFVEFPEGIKIDTIEGGGGANVTAGVDSTASAGKSVTIYPTFQYRLRPENFKDLWNKHGAKYAERISLNAKTIMKENFENFAVEDFFREREKVRGSFNRQMNDRLNAKMFDDDATIRAIDVPEGKFQLRKVVLDSRTRQRYLQVATRLQTNELNMFETIAQTERVKTQTEFVSPILQRLANVTQSAVGEESSIIQAAEAAAEKTRLQAVANGYKKIFDGLGITDGKHKMKLVQLMAIHSKSHVLVDEHADQTRKIYLGI